jgi:hypothetical protein
MCPLRTVSVTDPCTVFCAFTKDENSLVKSSGVYHAIGYTRSNLKKLVRTVRSQNNEQVTIKVAGYSQEDVRYLHYLKKEME